MIQKIALEHKDSLVWADAYAKGTTEEKKMIISRLINCIRVSRNYRIEIDFNINEKSIVIEAE